MAAHQLASLLRRLHRETSVRGVGVPADRVLLARFAGDHDEDAFATLVARHGPMVLSVCRRILADRHATEDAFQATFLVLARRAGSIRKAALLGNWLYGTAYRVASRARVEAAKRSSREQMVPARPSQDPLSEITVRELFEVLDRELHRLPDECRAALVACYLEDKSRDEAAAELGWSPATLGRRLERGRELLRSRLARRGLAPALTLFPAALARAASAGVPASLTESTVRTAIGFAAGSAPAVSVSGAITALAEGALRTMSITKCKIATALLVAASLVAAGVGMLPLTGAVAGPAQEEDAKSVAAPVNPASARVDPPKSDLQKLQGTWVLDETRYDGKIVVDNRQGLIAHSKILIDFNWLIMPLRDVKAEQHRSKLQIDESSDPKRITFANWYVGPAHGVYTLDGDTFQFCYEHGSKDSPAKFGAGLGSKNVLLIYKREPAGKEAGATVRPPVVPIVPKTDLQKLQGTWVLDVNAVDPGPNFVDPPHSKLVIEGWKFTLHDVSGGTQRSSGSSFEMDEAASGGRIAFNWPNNGKAHGIYDLEGDTFRFCYTPGAKEPPAQFGAGPGSKSVLLVYRREKAAKQETGTTVWPPVVPKTDLQILQGTWVLDAVAPDPLAVRPAHSKLEIDGHEFTMHLLDGGSGHHHSKLQINETANPRRITFDWLGGQAHGVYFLDGDKFTFCYTPGSKAPPAELGVGPGRMRAENIVILSYKREPRAAGNPEEAMGNAKERDAAEVPSQPLSPRDAVEKHTGKEVRVVFRVASAYSIFGGSVPRGQLPPFSLIPEAGEGDPAFSVLVSGELALVMDRFGVSQFKLEKFFKGKTVEVIGNIARLDPPKGAPDGKPSYRLAVSDWRKFRLLP